MRLHGESRGRCDEDGTLRRKQARCPFALAFFHARDLLPVVLLVGLLQGVAAFRRSNRWA